MCPALKGLQPAGCLSFPSPSPLALAPLVCPSFLILPALVIDNLLCRPYDIRMNEVFSAIGLQANWRGEMGLDFTQFDKTVPRNAR